MVFSRFLFLTSVSTGVTVGTVAGPRWAWVTTSVGLARRPASGAIAI